jgi:hypothetical protein
MKGELPVRFLFVAIWAGIFAWASSVSAHHSPTMFNMSKRINVKGVVREFQWTNPHCSIQLLVKDRSGKDVEWNLEMGAPIYLQDHGWRPSTLKAGQVVTVTMSPLLDGQHGGLVLAVVTADGQKLAATAQ